MGSVQNPMRHPSEHVTVTVVLYNTIVGGVPSQRDVVAAIDDLEALYAACGTAGCLVEDEFDFKERAQSGGCNGHRGEGGGTAVCSAFIRCDRWRHIPTAQGCLDKVGHGDAQLRST